MPRTTFWLGGDLRENEACVFLIIVHSFLSQNPRKKGISAKSSYVNRLPPRHKHFAETVRQAKEPQFQGD